MFKEIFAGFSFSNFRLHVDLGFLGIRKFLPDGTVLIPHKGYKKCPLTESQKQENTDLSRTRVVIENTIAKIKSFFVLRIENRMKIKQKLDDAIGICAELANFKTRNLLTISG